MRVGEKTSIGKTVELERTTFGAMLRVPNVAVFGECPEILIEPFALDALIDALRRVREAYLREMSK